MTQPATILVVDDTDGQRYAVTYELKRSGFRVIEAASGVEALTALRQNPDVVLLDVKLPDLSGFEVCRRIKDDELTARIPVIQTSANFTTSESKAEGLESGADAYLAQPFSTLELVATVNAVLRVRNAEAERERLLVELKAAAAAESRARAEAESAARRANSILESMGDAFFTLDRNWGFTYLNSQAERILRRPKDQLLGRTLWDEFPLAIGSIFEQNYRRVAESQTRACFEAFYEPFNTWVEVRAYPTADGLAVYFYDISARKQSEARLRQATERLAERTELLNSLLANAPVGFAFFDREYRYVRVNKFLAEINGISIADHLGKSIVELLPVAAKAVVPTLDHVFQHAEPVADLEVAGETPAQPGVTRYWHTGFYPVFGPDGAVQHVGAIVLEVTAQKLAENALRESEERLQLAQMAAGAGSWEWFIGTERVVLMPECLVLWGFDEQPTLRDVIDRIVEEDRTATERALRRAARGEGDFQAEFRITLPDGATRWIEGKGRLVAASANKPAKIIGINLDITERKLAEEVLIRTEKLASVGRLAATVAHEINNPLEAIMNAVYLAQTDPSISDEGRRQLAIADEEIVRAAHITRQTLGFYRENAAAVEVNIGELLEGVLELFGPRLRNKQIAVSRHYSPAVATVTAVPGELRQVVSNLISNSIDAVHAKGHLEVRVSPAFCRGTGDFVRLTVADDGCGISPENVRRIFEPFFTTKQAVGTGLGLWVTKGIIDKHKGSIRVRSKPGRGTVFTVYLPGAVKAKPDSTVLETKAAQSYGRTECTERSGD